MQISSLTEDFASAPRLCVEVVHAADAVIVAVERGEDAGLGLDCLEAGAGRGGEQEPEQHLGWRGGGEWRTLVSSDRSHSSVPQPTGDMVEGTQHQLCVCSVQRNLTISSVIYIKRMRIFRLISILRLCCLLNLFCALLYLIIYEWHRILPQSNPHTFNMLPSLHVLQMSFLITYR